MDKTPNLDEETTPTRFNNQRDRYNHCVQWSLHKQYPIYFNDYKNQITTSLS